MNMETIWYESNGIWYLVYADSIGRHEVIVASLKPKKASYLGAGAIGGNPCIIHPEPWRYIE